MLYEVITLRFAEQIDFDDAAVVPVGRARGIPDLELAHQAIGHRLGHRHLDQVADLQGPPRLGARAIRLAISYNFV